MSYCVRVATSSDFESIMSLVERDYIMDEPITHSFLLKRGVKLSDEEFRSMKKSMESVVKSSTCLVATDVLDKIVGVVAVILETKNQDDDSSSALHELDLSVGSIIESSKLLEQFPRSWKIGKLRMLTTDRDHRGRGLATILLQEAVAWAANNGVDVLWSLFTASASKRAGKKVGFESVHEYDLLDYRNAEGRAVFAATPNHVTDAMICRVSGHRD